MSKRSYDIKKQQEKPFLSACKLGNIRIVEWLIEEYRDQNISFYFHRGFVDACANEQIDIAKLLLTIEPINDDSIYNYVFKDACTKGHLSLVQWLLTIKPDIDISDDNEYACY